MKVYLGSHELTMEFYPPIVFYGMQPDKQPTHLLPIGSMYGTYANIGGILMVNVTIYSIHGSYGLWRSHLISTKNLLQRNEKHGGCPTIC